MNKSHKKIKLNIKGSFKKFWSCYLLKLKSWRMGVKLHDLKHPSSERVEVTVSGEMYKLWEIVRWSKKGSMFFSMNELLIEFMD